MKLGVKSGVGKAAAAALCAGLCCTLMAGAHAQSEPQNGQHQRKESRRDFRDSRWNDARAYEPREQRVYEPRYDQRADDQRRMMEENSNAEISRRTGRMTPDERRDLRRQINEAGQQVYSQPRRR